MTTVETIETLGVRFEHSGQQVTRELQLPAGSFRSSVAATDDGDLLGAWWASYLRGGAADLDLAATSSLSTLELFCGPGGLALGFRQACRELGIAVRSRGAIDQDADALAVYGRNHHPETAQAASVSSIVDYRVRGSGDAARFVYEPEMLGSTWEAMVGEVDVVLAGPPCQGHSNLNNHTRRIDLRNELYLTVPAVAVAVGAPIVIIENVPAVVHDRTGVVASTITILEAAGYIVESGVFKADAMGWPQRRSRYFLIARRGAAPLPTTAVSAALASPARSVMWAIGDLADADDDGHMNRRPSFNEDSRRRIDWLFDNDAYDLALSERPDCHREGTSYQSVYGRMYPDRPAPTITTGFLTPGRGRYVHPTRRRVLTPREAARLQGFPDDYVFEAEAGSVPHSAQLTKWIGDAVPMPLGYAATISALGSGW